MNTFAHRLSAFSAIMHLIIGLSEIVLPAPRFLPPAWAAVYLILPDWGWRFWPGLFCLAGIVAAVGFKKAGALRWGFRLSALCFLIWSLAGVYSWWAGTGSNITGIAVNLYVTGGAFVLSHYVRLGVRSDKINQKIMEAYNDPQIIKR